MTTLETKLTLDAGVAKAANLTERFTLQDLDSIGRMVSDGYERDQQSRADWLRRNQAGMDLALQLQKDKSFPWPGSSNVAFPLITIAALQLHSRAYPTLISGTSVVKCRVPGPDPKGEATARAHRVGTYMSYQVLEEDQAWEEQHDRLLIQVPIVGCAFVKTYHSTTKGHNNSELIPAVNLVMDYYAKSVEAASRKTEILSLSRNQVYERCRSGTWRDVLDEAWYNSITSPTTTPGVEEADKRKGMNAPLPDESTPLTFLEQHCYFDFDQDGYQEPYIITVDLTSKQVVRIVARWERPEDVERNARNEVVRIQSAEYYTKYELIPSPDGSVYGLGFGVLMGPLNEATNSLLNQIIDAGTLSNAAGGFLSRGVKIRGGAYQASPFRWERVDSTGDDLHKGIFPLPVREPSNVLFQCLSFLVNYTQRVGGASDAVSGENPGQNTPAQTQQSMVEQGMMIYSAIFKRLWRSMKEEFRKLYILNARYMPIERNFGMGGKVAREDFLGDPSQIAPVADPNVTSDQMRLQKAMAIAERAQTVPGYDKVACERNLLAAMKIDGIEVLFPGPEKMPPTPNPKVMIEQAKLQSKEKIAAAQLELDKMEFLETLQMEQQLNTANIIKMLAQAEALAAQASTAATGQQIELINAMIGAARARDEALRGHISNLISHMEATTAAKQAEQANAEPSK